MTEIERLRIAVRRLTSLVRPGCSRCMLSWIVQEEVERSESEFNQKEKPRWALDFDPTKEIR